MTPEQFAYWLQGFVEPNDGKMPTKAQWKTIREHLATVFVKVTPPVEPLPKRLKLSPDSTKQVEDFLRQTRITCSRDTKIC